MAYIDLKLPKLTNDQYHDIDARLTEYYELSETSSSDEVLRSVSHALKNYKEVAEATKVAPMMLFSFFFRWVATREPV